MDVYIVVHTNGDWAVKVGLDALYTETDPDHLVTIPLGTVHTDQLEAIKDFKLRHPGTTN